MEGTPYLSNEKNLQDNVSIINIYIPKCKGIHICKRNSINLRSHIDPHTLKMRDSTLHPHQWSCLSDRDLNGGTRELTHDMAQIDFIKMNPSRPPRIKTGFQQ